MKLKYYGTVPNLSEAIKYYEYLFDAKIIKDGTKTKHAYLKLFGQISFLLYEKEKVSLKEDSLVIRFDKQEIAIFKKAFEKVMSEKNTEIIYPLQKWSWKTTQVMKFKDKYGYVWVFEKDVE